MVGREIATTGLSVELPVVTLKALAGGSAGLAANAMLYVSLMTLPATCNVGGVEEISAGTRLCVPVEVTVKVATSSPARFWMAAFAALALLSIVGAV